LGLDEWIELTKIYNMNRLLLAEVSMIQSRPFRSPHHTTSPAGLIGGGRIPRPGEVSLAHHGILFLDKCRNFHSFGLFLILPGINET
jgi:magnesium chelatase family protein